MALRAGDPALYVAERPGRVRAIRDGQLVPQLVLDITSMTRAQGERGFLGMAFAPDGSHLYVSYTDQAGDSHVDEYVVGADGSVDPATRRQVLFQEQPYANHNGGGIVFGPDGLLYIGFGDGGSAGDPERRALRLDTWLGKLLRIDPRPDGAQPYRVPPDNPFVGQEAAKPEIWSYGLRNPWRFSFDAATGDLWIGDVGQNRIEEIDLAPAASGGGKGLNFGWSAFEGTRRFNEDQPAEGTVGPVHEYAHNDEPGGCSVTGGYVYRGTAIPALQGAYVFADYCARGVRALDPAAPAEAAVIVPERGSIVSFGEGPDREVYVLTLDNQVWQLLPA
jgi:glucose/arabinose dehydrogenase